MANKGCFILAAGSLSVAIIGCQNKEPIADVETPAGRVEVERNTESGEVSVEVSDNE